MHTIGRTHFRRAFGCVPVGPLAGLIGLGGGEFRLSVPTRSVGFSAKSAAPVDRAASLVTSAFALGTRNGVVCVADAARHGAEIAGLAAGGMVAASPRSSSCSGRTS